MSLQGAPEDGAPSRSEVRTPSAQSALAVRRRPDTSGAPR